MADPIVAPLLIGATLAKTFVDVQAQSADIKSLNQQAGLRAELANQQFKADAQNADREAATLRARFAAQGLAYSGSSLLVQEDQARSSDFDARLRRFSTLNEGVNLLNDADQARAKRTGTLLTAGASLLGDA